jgi:hypothetical protein
MDARTRFVVGFLAICFACSALSIASISFLPREPMMRWVPLASFAAAVAGVYWLRRHFRGRLPALTPEQRQRAIKAHRRQAWIYLGGLAFGLIAEGKVLFALPHGLGLLIPLVPIGLATIHLHSAAQLRRKEPESANSTAQY